MRCFANAQHGNIPTNNDLRTTDKSLVILSVAKDLGQGQKENEHRDASTN